MGSIKSEEVLEVYRITLLSNRLLDIKQHMGVLEVYRITLLSNYDERIVRTLEKVLEVYRITLLSNYSNIS